MEREAQRLQRRPRELDDVVERRSYMRAPRTLVREAMRMDASPRVERREARRMDASPPPPAKRPSPLRVPSPVPPPVSPATPPPPPPPPLGSLPPQLPARKKLIERFRELERPSEAKCVVRHALWIDMGPDTQADVDEVLRQPPQAPCSALEFQIYREKPVIWVIWALSAADRERMEQA